MALLQRKEPINMPVRVLQFGEGNFLRAFIDWMIEKMNTECGFNSMVQVVQPINGTMCERINAQGGLYTLILRGVEEGKVCENSQIIHCVKSCLNPYTEWSQVVACAVSPELRFVFSNTTEAGIEYRDEAYTPGVCQNTYPAKVAALLYARFQAGMPGLIFLPCELIDRNGATLKKYILQYAAAWQLPAAFADWVNSACLFVNTLVDRIVAGYPKNEAAEIEKKLGYEDKLIDCGEIFHFLAIEGPQSLLKELPFDRAGLRVAVADDITPYRTRKVRFLNGAHTANVPAALLGGLTFVDEMMSDPDYGAMVRRAVFEEIYPTVNLPDEEKTFYAKSIIERFENPFAAHQLSSISLNSVSKWKVRVQPCLVDYAAMFGKLPPVLTFSLAVLIRFYQITDSSGDCCGKAGNITYKVNDSQQTLQFFAQVRQQCLADGDNVKYITTILGNKALWDMDLNTIPSLRDAVLADWQSLNALGSREAVRRLLQK